jgi:hypothetical protein
MFACCARQLNNGTAIPAEWLTNSPISKPGSLSFYRRARSRREIENSGFNDGKSRYGMERICHHEPNSIWSSGC